MVNTLFDHLICRQEGKLIVFDNYAEARSHLGRRDNTYRLTPKEFVELAALVKFDKHGKA